MSGGATPPEIEVVLASIRDLVSPESKVRTGKSPGMLVLTDAQRVRDGDVHSAGSGLGGPPASAPRVTEAIPTPTGRDSERFAERKSEGVDTRPPSAGRRRMKLVASAPVARGLAGEAVSGSITGERGAHPSATRSLRDRIAELEAAVAARYDDFEPDGSEPDALPAFRHRPVAVPRQAERSAAASESPVIRSREEATPGAEPATETPRAIRPTSEEGGGAVAGRADDAGPIASDDDNFLSGAQEPLTEDALRELISEILRDELQGALGERITRNVRKLVRREIMRAMTLREFE